MLTLYTPDGNTHAAYLDKDCFPMPPTDGYSLYTVDEKDPDNDQLCKFLLLHSSARDAVGESKYQIFPDENGVPLMREPKAGWKAEVDICDHH